MKIQIASDLHCEHQNDYGDKMIEGFDPSGVDVLVLAGDIGTLGNYHRLVSIFKRFTQKYKNVIYVHGNHEYYGTNVKNAEVNSVALGRLFPNLHILRVGDNVTIEGQRFLGGTLWFKDDPSNLFYRGLLSDFQTIDDFDPWVYRESERMINNLEVDLASTDVVVSHHMPSPLCTHPKFKGSVINRFFVNDVSDLIARKQPKLWIHGHTHERVDTIIGNTRIIANPRGYPNERVETPFDPKFVVEV